MPSTSYVPLEKYELHSYPPELHTSSPFPNSLSHTTLPHAKLRKSFDSELQNTPYPFASGIPLKTASEKRPTRNNSALELLKALFLPMVAIVYLAFCYLVHFRVIHVSAHGILNTSPRNIGKSKFLFTSRYHPNFYKEACICSLYQSWCDIYQHFNCLCWSLAFEESHTRFKGKYQIEPVVNRSHIQLSISERGVLSRGFFSSIWCTSLGCQWHIKSILWYIRWYKSCHWWPLHSFSLRCHSRWIVYNRNLDVSACCS